MVDRWRMTMPPTRTPLFFLQLTPAIYPYAADRITRVYKLNPRLLGVPALRRLQTVYSTSASATAAFQLLTGCATPFPSCGSKVAAAGSTAACNDYVAGLNAFCNGTRQNYDSAACVAALTTQPVDAQGSVSAITARAFFAACFDFLAEFNSDNGFSSPGDGTLLNREYLVTGDALLGQSGGYEIIWLEI
jgi:hypothetical protein